jgi:ketosteroid isomerase-like protein
MLSLYEPDAVLNPTPEGPVRGKEAIRAALNGFLELGGKMAITTLAVFEGPDGIAMSHGEWSLKGESVELAGKTAEVLRRQADGRWLYLIDNPWA